MENQASKRGVSCCHLTQCTRGLAFFIKYGKLVCLFSMYLFVCLFIIYLITHLLGLLTFKM